MKDIIIVCAGGYGKELYTVVNETNRIAGLRHKERPYNLLGFLSDVPNALDGSGISAPILGTIQDWKPIGDEVYAVGLSDPQSKKKVVDILKGKGCHFETVIAPWSIVSEDCICGEGCFITAYSISSGVKLGNFVNVMGSMICAGAEIGDFSTTTGFTVVENAKIGSGVFVGSHAVVTEGVQVGDNAKVSAGSIVDKDVPQGITVYGIPARELG